MVRSALVPLGVALALAGCSAEPAPPPPPATTTSASVAPTTRQLQPVDVLRAETRNSTIGLGASACGQSVPPTDPTCGEHLTLVEQTLTKVQAELVRLFPGRDLGKSKETADLAIRSVSLVRRMNCYAMNGADKKPGKNESELCATIGRLALVQWLNYETTVGQL